MLLATTYQPLDALIPRATNPRTHSKTADRPDRLLDPALRLHQSGTERI
jgi:hypothetical protein